MHGIELEIKYTEHKSITGGQQLDKALCSPVACFCKICSFLLLFTCWIAVCTVLCDFG